MRYLLLCAVLLAVSGCTDQLLSDVNSIGEGAMDAAPLVAPFNPAAALLIAAGGGIAMAIAGALLKNRKKAAAKPKPKGK